MLRNQYYDVSNLDIEQLKTERDTSKYHAIYWAAKNNREDALKTILSKGAFLNEIFDNQTPAGKLAKEGNTKAVTLLIKYGALIDDIVSGFARGGYFHQAEFFQQLFEIPISAIALGSAEINSEYTNDLITKGASPLQAAIGAIRGKRIAYAEELRIKHNLNVDLLCRTAAECGLSDYVNELYYSEDSLEDSYNTIIGYSHGGYFDRAESFLNNSPKNYFLAILRGAAEGGYCQLVEKLCSNSPIPIDILEIMNIIDHASLFGHYDYTAFLTNKYKIKYSYLLASTMDKFNFDYAQTIYKQLDIDELNASCFIHTFASPPIKLYYFTQIREPFAKNEFLKIKHSHAIQELEFEINKPHDEPLSTEEEHDLQQMKLSVIELKKNPNKAYYGDIISFAGKLQHLMNSYNLNYTQAIKWIEPWMKIWLLQGIALTENQTIPLNIYFCITAELIDTVYDNAVDLYYKYTFQFYKNCIASSLDKRNEKIFFGFFNSNSKAVELSNQCNNASSKNELNLILNSNVMLDDFHEISDHYLPKLDRF